MWSAVTGGGSRVMMKLERARWLIFYLSMALAASAEAQSRLEVTERQELKASGALLTADGPGVVADGARVLVSAGSLSRTNPGSRDLHLWLLNPGDKQATYVHPRLGADARLQHALFLAAFPLSADRILALFALDREALGIVEVTRDGGVRVIATAKRPWGDVEVRRLVRMRDGSYVAAGRAEASPFALRFKDDGEILWSQVRPDLATGFWTDVAERQDGSLLLIGQVLGAKELAAGGTEAVLAELDAKGNVLRDTRRQAGEAILVGPAERLQLLARDLKSKAWALHSLASKSDLAGGRSLVGDLRGGGWLARAARLDDGSAALTEPRPGMQADVAVIREDGAIVRSEPIAGVMAPSACLAAGAGGAVLALFAEMPSPGPGGGVEGALVLVRLDQGK